MKIRKNALAAAVAISLASVAHAQSSSNREVQQMNTVLKAGGVLAAWDRGFTGSGVTIGVIDQGFNLKHTDLAGSVLDAKNFYRNGAPVTWGTHGSAMASIIAGNLDGKGTVGVAPDAMLLLGQVGVGGSSGSISKAAVYKAIDWMSSQGATAINMSFGYTYDATFQKSVKLMNSSQRGVYVSTNQRYGVNYGQTYADLNAYAVGTNRNSVLVAAAGNQGLAYSAFPGVFATRTDSNGNLVLGGKMLIVGAASPDGKKMASFSNRAGHLCQNVSGNTCTDQYQVKDFYVVAPGMQIYGDSGTNNTTAVAGNGTSQAAAYVSGGIALMKQAWPQLRAEQLVALTLNTATDLGAKGVDEVYGYGMVNFDRATAPQGNLTVATRHQKLGGGSTASGTSAYATGMTVSGSIGGSLKQSSVLGNTQAVDSYGRNYAVDFTRAINSNSAMTYQYASPWLALSPAGYQQVQTELAPGKSMMMARSDSGVASQFNWKEGLNTYQVQVGAMVERDGFLGNSGSGAMGLGSSSTSFTMLGLERDMGNDLAVSASYGVGYTQTSNNADSIIQLDGRLVTDTFKLGLTKANLATRNDSFQVSLSSPVSVRSGKAHVSAVTGYEYSDEDANGDVYATPITESESVSLRPTAREYNVALGYSAPVTKLSAVSVNAIQQFNAGGMPGARGNMVGFTFTAKF